jgi:hypothetical protein
MTLVKIEKRINQNSTIKTDGYNFVKTEATKKENTATVMSGKSKTLKMIQKHGKVLV